MSNPAPRETPNPATSTRPRESSTRVARKKPLAWLPLAILALLILLALLIAFLLAKANDDDSSSDTASSANTSVSAAAGSTADASGPSSGSSGSTTAGGAAAAASASLTVAGQDLLALSDGSLAAQSGKPATGTATVESVVSDEGFWVGTSKTTRVFVFLTPEARKSGGESGFQVTAGQKITLTGQVVTVASSPSSAAGVTDSEGKAQLVRQGALVRADSVALS